MRVALFEQILQNNIASLVLVLAALETSWNEWSELKIERCFYHISNHSGISGRFSKFRPFLVGWRLYPKKYKKDLKGSQVQDAT